MIGRDFTVERISWTIGVLKRSWIRWRMRSNEGVLLCAEMFLRSTFWWMSFLEDLTTKKRFEWRWWRSVSCWENGEISRMKTLKAKERVRSIDHRGWWGWISYSIEKRHVEVWWCRDENADSIYILWMDDCVSMSMGLIRVMFCRLGLINPIRRRESYPIIRSAQCQ